MTNASLLKQSTGVGNFVVDLKRGLSARVNPLVPMNVLDSFMRRQDGEKRAIGALLGFVSEGGILDIVDSFTIVHSDRADGVALEIEYHKKMTQLRTSVHPKEQVIGWYSVGPRDEFSDDHITQTVTMQQFFASKESLFAGSAQLDTPVGVRRGKIR